MDDGGEVAAVGTDGSRWVGHVKRHQDGGEHIEVSLADGRRVTFPTDVVVRQADGTVRLPVAAGDLAADRRQAVVPAVREELVVGKREEERGRVVVHVVPGERTEVIDVPVAQEEVEVERRTINEFVKEVAPVRQEGEVTVVPVYEEVIVVERRLMLKEEVRVRRRRTERHERHEVRLRSEDVQVLRADGPPERAAD